MRSIFTLKGENLCLGLMCSNPMSRTRHTSLMSWERHNLESNNMSKESWTQESIAMEFAASLAKARFEHVDDHPKHGLTFHQFFSVIWPIHISHVKHFIACRVFIGLQQNFKAWKTEAKSCHVSWVHVHRVHTRSLPSKTASLCGYFVLQC